MQAVYAAYPLDYEKEEIRLITIILEDWDCSLTGSFTGVSLLNPVPAYAALSYAWDDPTTNTVMINIENQVLHVSRSLHYALRRLKWHAYHAGQPLTIWADGVLYKSS